MSLNGRSRLWNRDLVATLNFRRIWNGLETAQRQGLAVGQGRPNDLRRQVDEGSTFLTAIQDVS
jgi:hypothetical protein